ncbi:pentapeptide repeat-containing protein [Rhodococcus sp. IEGM 1366]|uniref:pentapeptide repeat-containing protein n=1 Tax=Rhodococcus sp. IEGM 1366 TaxID=3082223 RepID=UPI002953BE69|nr:pentapeptide repeat-containing protein [Rhodococcus sp. IEGM 1366]MDV8071165.1 pentapeptide repeat-containing protein [Rhodococcus sp. IEGM 1366]
MRGAIISGVLTIPRSAEVVTVSAQYCRFGDFVATGGVTFGGNIRFNGTAFTGAAYFEMAMFHGAVGFGQATFNRTVQFGRATFDKYVRFGRTTFNDSVGFGGTKFNGSGEFGMAKFGETAKFNGATFGKDAGFRGTRFGGAAGFSAAKFGGSAEFSGAKFDAEARFADVTIAGSAVFSKSRFARNAGFGAINVGGAARFDGAKFGGTAAFGGANFGSDAGFDGAIFSSNVGFSGTDFCRTAKFNQVTFLGSAKFSGATFTGAARFDLAKFDKGATFSSATFSAASRFDGARYSGPAGFNESTFGSDTTFDGVEFGGEAKFCAVTLRQRATFSGVTFNSASRFDRVRFGGPVSFEGSTFGGDATFDGATFDALARPDFSQVVARSLEFQRVKFHSAIEGAWATELVSFVEAIFDEPTIIRALCRKMDISRAEFRSGGTIEIRGGSLDASAANFGARTVLSDPGADAWKDWIGVVASERGVTAVRVSSAEPLASLLTDPPRLQSLRRTAVANLELSAVDLTECRFAGAHGLDKMQIDSACAFPTAPADTAFRKPVRFTRRTVIADERMWREQNATWDQSDSGSSTHSANAPDIQVVPTSDMPARDVEPASVDPDGATTEPAGVGALRTGSTSAEKSTTPTAPTRIPDNERLDATEVAGIYRSLRKGLEDASNEPGAADFYYGEMEMRRLAHRMSSATGHKPSFFENWLLTAYWLVSGYGLRAWRAFTAIGVVIAAATVVFATVGVQDPPGMTEKASWVHPLSGAIGYEQVPKASFGWGDSFELAARNSVALLRNPSNTPDLTPAGTVADISIRLLVPVLLALAVLAIRGRTKR